MGDNTEKQAGRDNGVNDKKTDDESKIIGREQNVQQSVNDQQLSDNVQQRQPADAQLLKNDQLQIASEQQLASEKQPYGEQAQLVGDQQQDDKKQLEDGALQDEQKQLKDEQQLQDDELPDYRRKRKPRICAEEGCKKRLPIHSFPCRCEKFYCSLHIVQHNCTFDYHKDEQERIEKNNPKVVADKIVKI